MDHAVCNTGPQTSIEASASFSTRRGGGQAVRIMMEVPQASHFLRDGGMPYGGSIPTLLLSLMSTSALRQVFSELGLLLAATPVRHVTITAALRALLPAQGTRCEPVPCGVPAFRLSELPPDDAAGAPTAGATIAGGSGPSPSSPSPSPAAVGPCSCEGSDADSLLQGYLSEPVIEHFQTSRDAWLAENRPVSIVFLGLPTLDIGASSFELAQACALQVRPAAAAPLPPWLL